MQTIKFTFKSINEEGNSVLNLTLTSQIELYNQSLERVVEEMEKVIYSKTNELGYDTEFHDVKEKVIYKGYKYLSNDTYYLTIEVECDEVDFSKHGFSE